MEKQTEQEKARNHLPRVGRHHQDRSIIHKQQFVEDGSSSSSLPNESKASQYHHIIRDTGDGRYNQNLSVDNRKVINQNHHSTRHQLSQDENTSNADRSAGDTNYQYRLGSSPNSERNIG
jgi:hypothetical protein